ncbi:RHS repeat-associated core domain-containing protein [Chryseobacterium polytrichastri]|nr:RHS repeat-associated core domain-containing protein [Chryseobacterium polytrichastri]
MEVTDTNNYYAFGMNHIGGMKSLLGGYQNYKYNGKELQESGMYDYGARMYMPDLGRWGVVDPLAEKYRRWSPYNYVMDNPLRFIDPDGRGVETVKPTNEASLKAIQNTLPKEDRQFVKLDKDGNVDRKILNSHKSTSGNYSNLSELVNSETTIEYTVGSSVSYYDKKGNSRKDDASEIRYGNPDKGMHVRTGESSDLMGTTLVPSNDKRTSEKVNLSTNNNLQVYTNGNLSEEGQAQNASHELIGGHALFYVRGETWVHQVKGSKWEGDTLIRIEGNNKLQESMTKSIDETINNMR